MHGSRMAVAALESSAGCRAGRHHGEVAILGEHRITRPDYPGACRPNRLTQRSAGRVGVTSLLAIDTGLYGQLDNWIASARRLHQQRRIDAQTLDDIRLISSFADLTANTDKHFGNLAFYDDYDGRFRLTPVYDMLPMLFAPAHDQIVARRFTPAGPTSDTLTAWGRARSPKGTGAPSRTTCVDIRRVSHLHPMDPKFESSATQTVTHFSGLGKRVRSRNGQQTRMSHDSAKPDITPR